MAVKSFTSDYFDLKKKEKKKKEREKKREADERLPKTSSEANSKSKANFMACARNQISP